MRTRLERKEELMRKSHFLRLAVLLGAVFAMVLASPAMAQDGSSDGHSSVVVTHAWSRPAIVGGNGAVYFHLANLSDQEIVLIGAASDVARVTEIHETVLVDPADQVLHGDHDEHAHHHDDAHHHHDDHAHHHDDHMDHHDHHMHMGHAAGGVFIMRHLEQLPIGGGQEVHFAPAGYHIMLIDLVETLAWGSTFEITLYFDDGSEVVVEVAVGDEPAH